MKLTLLGTGTSNGVPPVYCMMTDYQHCPQNVCREAEHDPKHRRARCSMLVEVNGKQILIDTTPDFRSQMLTYQVKKLDAVLFTHCHADHIYGLADIRPYCWTPEMALPIYGSDETISALKRSFRYIFTPPDTRGGGIPNLTPHVIAEQSPLDLFGLEVVPGRVEHGGLQGCFGYRLGPVGYISDIKQMPAETKPLFQDLDVLILNCLRIAPDHATHLSLADSLALADELRAKRCYLIHMTHDIHYQKDQALLPNHVSFAFDGLCLQV